MSVTMEVSPMVVLEAGFDQYRTGNRKEGGPLGHYATRDGAVSIVAYMPEHWRILAQWVHDETGVEEIPGRRIRGHADFAQRVRRADRPLDRGAHDAVHQAGLLRGGATARDHGCAGELRETRLDDADLHATAGWTDYEGPWARNVARSHTPIPRRWGHRAPSATSPRWVNTTSTSSWASWASPKTTCSHCGPTA